MYDYDLNEIFTSLSEMTKQTISIRLDAGGHLSAYLIGRRD